MHCGFYYSTIVVELQIFPRKKGMVSALVPCVDSIGLKLWLAKNVCPLKILRINVRKSLPENMGAERGEETQKSKPLHVYSEVSH